MKNCIAVLLFGAAVLLAAPSFGSYTWIYDSGVKIDVGYYGAPCIVDWDGDGLKDLVLGQFTSGNIRYYQNTDSNDSPVFTGYRYIQSDGANITLPSG